MAHTTVHTDISIEPNTHRLATPHRGVVAFVAYLDIVAP